MPAIENGAKEGQQVGNYLVSKLKTRKSAKSTGIVAQVK
jgi:hypothetical protein